MGVENDVLVSLIIPAYNCEKYINRSLESVLNQAHSNLQIIVIDDGSTDSTGEICDCVANHDSRVEVVHKKNEGVSVARNCGLDRAKGKYVAFVDADDVIDFEYISTMLSAAEQYECGIVTCQAMVVNQNGMMRSNMKSGKVQVVKISEYDFMKNWSHATVWGALFSRQLLNGLTFDKELFVGEDSLFFASALIRCESVVHIFDELYFYYVYDSSALHGTYDGKKITEIDAWDKIIALVANKGKTVASSSRARLVRHALSGFNNNIKYRNEYCYRQKLQNAVKSNLVFYLNSDVSAIKKMRACLIAYVPFVYSVIYKSYRSVKRNRSF